MLSVGGGYARARAARASRRPIFRAYTIDWCAPTAREDSVKHRGVIVAVGAGAVLAAFLGLAIAKDDQTALAAAAASDAAATTPIPSAPAPAAVAPPQPAPATPPAAAAQPQPAPAAPPAAAAPNPAALSQAQLDQLLAPVALYPDQLLDQVLMASTYPLEIVEADRWVKQPAHARLRGQRLMAALAPNHWDPAVMAMVPFPRLLDVMSERIDWTRRLGDAFL